MQLCYLQLLGDTLVSIGLLFMGEVKILKFGVALMKKMCGEAKGSVPQIIQHFRGNRSCSVHAIYSTAFLLQLTLFVGLLNINLKLTRSIQNVGWVGSSVSSTLLLNLLCTSQKKGAELGNRLLAHDSN